MLNAWAGPLASDRRETLDHYYREYHQELCRHAVTRYGLSPVEAEDLVQLAFIRVTPLFETAQIENVRAFLYTTVSNAAVDTLRRRQVRESYVQSVQVDQDLDVDHAGPERIASGRQFLGLVSRALWAMPYKRRKLLLMNRVDGLSYAEIARREGLSATVVKKHVAKALAGCQAALRANGGEL